ncbi:unnamed protein product [Pedinophyceae sp. YPF-701]|nr:unnamed protein product [Pedinophyceae sp. YPF-701]
MSSEWRRRTAQGPHDSPTPSPPSLRIVSPGLDLSMHCETCVAVIPIGGTTDEEFAKYFKLISQHGIVPLSSCRSFYHEESKSPFTALRWDVGHVRYRFLRGPIARETSIWRDLHAHQRVWAVLGIVHCPSCPGGLEAALERFEAIVGTFGGSCVSRLYAFEPGESELDAKYNTDTLIVFPPGQLADTPVSARSGDSVPPSPIQVRRDGGLQHHLATMMWDLTARVVMELEAWVLTLSPAMFPLPCSLDHRLTQDDTPSARSRAEGDFETRRRLGRMRKHIGDCCLLAGAPRNALEHYSSAIDLARSTGDGAWVAGVLEGTAAAKVAVALEPVVHDAISRGAGAPGAARWPLALPPEVFRGVRTDLMVLLPQAKVNFRRKGAWWRSTELDVMLANFVAAAETPPGGHSEMVGKDLTLGMEEVAAETTFLTPLDRAILLMECAGALARCGLVRKARLAVSMAAGVAPAGGPLHLALRRHLAMGTPVASPWMRLVALPGTNPEACRSISRRVHGHVDEMGVMGGVPGR